MQEISNKSSVYFNADNLKIVNEYIASIQDENIKTLSDVILLLVKNKDANLQTANNDSEFENMKVKNKMIEMANNELGIMLDEKDKECSDLKNELSILQAKYDSLQKTKQVATKNEMTETPKRITLSTATKTVDKVETKVDESKDTSKHHTLFGW